MINYVFLLGSVWIGLYEHIYWQKHF